MLKKILAPLTILLLVCMIFAAYMGAFKKMEVSEKSFGPYWLIHKTHTGAYSDTSALFSEFFNWRAAQKLSQSHLFGIYYDDPGRVEESKLRSEVGLTLSEEEYDQFSKTMQKNGFHFKKLDARKYIFTTFPYKNTASIFLGLFKAYPALKKYAKRQGHSSTYSYKETDHQNQFAMEIYDESGRNISYLITIE